MQRSTRVRRTLAAMAAVALIITGTVSTASAASAAISPVGVTKMASLGDSITLGLMSCSSLLSGCPTNSWATGSNTAVNSQALRLKAQNGGAALTTYNNSVSGVLSSGLNAQAQKAVQQGAQYVTIEIGANDACTKTTALMTPVATFKANIDAALLTLSQSAAPPQIFVASIPNLQNMWSVNKSNASARLTWGLLRICQSMLANPTSTSTTDNARRAAVTQRVMDYNAALAQSCNAYPTICRYDQGAVFGTTFNSTHISTRDYFHPSIAGQALLASVTWPKTQWQL